MCPSRAAGTKRGSTALGGCRSSSAAVPTTTEGDQHRSEPVAPGRETAPVLAAGTTGAGAQQRASGRRPHRSPPATGQDDGAAYPRPVR
jgi:hypothetical protein